MFNSPIEQIEEDDNQVAAGIDILDSLKIPAAESSGRINSMEKKKDDTIYRVNESQILDQGTHIEQSQIERKNELFKLKPKK